MVFILFNLSKMGWGRGLIDWMDGGREEGRKGMDYGHIDL